MSELQNLQGIDWRALGYGLIAIIVFAVALIKIIGELSKIVGKPVKWVKKREDERAAILKAVNSVNELGDKYVELEKESRDGDEKLKEDITELKDLFIDKDINDMRMSILNFASSISRGDSFSKEQFVEVVNVMDRYSEIIKKYGRKNGRAEISMQLITDHYKKHLENNDWEYGYTTKKTMTPVSNNVEKSHIYIKEIE